MYQWASQFLLKVSWNKQTGLALMSPHYLMVFIQSAPKKLQAENAAFLTVMCNIGLRAVLLPKEWKRVNVKN